MPKFKLSKNTISLIFTGILFLSLALIATNIPTTRDTSSQAATGSQTRSPAGSGSSNSCPSSSADWTDTWKIQNNDQVYTTATTTGSVYTNCLHGDNFNFSIPSGANIDNVVIKIDRKAGHDDASHSVRDNHIEIRQGNNFNSGQICGPGNCFNEHVPTSDSQRTITYSHPNLTPAIINSSSFRLTYQGFVEQSTAYIDHFQITVNYTITPKPTANLRADSTSVSYNSPTTLRWSSTNATSCTAGGDWSGTYGASGSKGTGNLTNNKYFSISCFGAGGESLASFVNITVGSPPPNSDPDLPPDDSGSTQQPPPPGGGLPSLPPPPTSIPGVDAPIDPNIVNILKINLSVPYLLGNIKSPLIVGGFAQDLELKPGQTDYEVDVRGTKFALGRTLNIQIGGNKALIKKLNIKTKAPKQPVKFGALYLGDTNRDNKINEKDITTFLDSLKNKETNGDINLDGAINSFDWAILIANFGRIGDR